MPKKTSKASNLTKLAVSVREFADSLPSAAEKQELQSSIAAIIGFLSDMERVVAAAPSREDTHAAQTALHTFEEFIGRARSNPSLAVLLGLQAAPPRKPRSQPSGFSSEDVLGAQQLLKQLQELPVDIMKSRLGDESNVSPRLLQALASELGLKSAQRMSRETLEHQIASRILNYRGYQDLRAGTDA